MHKGLEAAPQTTTQVRLPQHWVVIVLAKVPAVVCGGLVWCVEGWCGVEELVWCVKGWCGVWRVGVVCGELVWCVEGWCGVGGLVWCVEGWCGV